MVFLVHNIYTYCQLIVVQWHHMISQDLVNIGSGYGFWPDSTKPSPEAMGMSCGIHQREIPWEMLKMFWSLIQVWKNTNFTDLDYVLAHVCEINLRINLIH